MAPNAPLPERDAPDGSEIHPLLGVFPVAFLVGGLLTVARVWLEREAALGVGLWWEQRYWVHRLGYAHMAANFRKNDHYRNYLDVVARHDTRPVHPRASDPDDPLHAARAKEVTSLWRLRAA